MFDTNSSQAQTGAQMEQEPPESQLVQMMFGAVLLFSVLVVLVPCAIFGYIIPNLRKDRLLVAAAEKLREKQGRANRPAWALTEDKAKEAAEKQEEDDTAELLEFAQNLDFDKVGSPAPLPTLSALRLTPPPPPRPPQYIDDMEVQAMIDQVKTRINELEIMKDEDLEAEEVKGEARPHTLTEESVRRLQEKYGVAAEEKPADDDAISVAKSLLSNTDLNKVRWRGIVAQHRFFSSLALATLLPHFGPLAAFRRCIPRSPLPRWQHLERL